MELRLYQAADALHRAAESGDLQEVTALIAEGADVSAFKGDWTPLHRAAARGHTGVARALLDADARIDETGAAGWTPLHRAAKLGHEEMTALLLERGADANARGIDDWTPLLRAAMAGEAATARLLIAAGAEITARSAANDWTPLHWAAFSGSLELARELIAAGAAQHVSNRTGATPLRLATHYGNDDVAELLRMHMPASGMEDRNE